MPTWRAGRTIAVVSVAALGAVVAGCSEAPGQLVYDSVPEETTTTEPLTIPTVAPVVVTEPPTGDDRVGQNWSFATGNLEGLESECGNLSFLSVRPDGRSLIAVVALQGMWTSSDNGGTWTHLGEGAGSVPVTNRGASIVYDPLNPDRFWESGTYTGGGVLRTDDGGDTFQRLGDIGHVEALSIDFSDPDRQTMMVGGHETTEVFRSSDGGETWTDVSDGLPAGSGVSGQAFVVNAQIQLVGTRASEGAGVFRTTDGGATWRKVWSGGVAGPPTVVGNAIYFLLERGQGLIVSLDGGATWSDHGGGGLSWNDGSLVALPDGRLVGFSERQLLISGNVGESWRPIGPLLPFEPAGLVYAPASDRFFIWHFDCGFDESLAVAADAIAQLEFTPVGELTPEAAAGTELPAGSTEPASAGTTALSTAGTTDPAASETTEPSG